MEPFPRLPRVFIIIILRPAPSHPGPGQRENRAESPSGAGPRTLSFLSLCDSGWRGEEPASPSILGWRLWATDVAPWFSAESLWLRVHTQGAGDGGMSAYSRCSNFSVLLSNLSFLKYSQGLEPNMYSRLIFILPLRTISRHCKEEGSEA